MLNKEVLLEAKPITGDAKFVSDAVPISPIPFDHQ
jgi:hypothetical protein